MLQYTYNVEEYSVDLINLADVCLNQPLWLAYHKLLEKIFIFLSLFADVYLVFLV